MTNSDEWVPLDEMTREQIDALPFGVIQVDRDGTVFLYNATESLFSGRPVEGVIGRDFFRDVAPCTHLPAFMGASLTGYDAATSTACSASPSDSTRPRG